MAAGDCWPNAYTDGFRSGYLDARLGFRLIVSLTAPCREYAAGYRRGQAKAAIEAYERDLRQRADR